MKINLSSFKKSVSKSPKIGDERMKRKFAWLPIVFCDAYDKKKYLVWFSSYYVKQVYLHTGSYIKDRTLGGFEMSDNSLPIIDWTNHNHFISNTNYFNYQRTIIRIRSEFKNHEDTI